MKIILLGSTYSLFIFLLLNKNINKREECFYLVGESIKKTIHNYNFDLILNIKKKNIITFLLYSLYLKFKLRRIKIEEVYGNDHIFMANYFLKNYKFSVIEDGTSNYSNLGKIIKNNKNNKILKRILKNILGIKLAYGLSKNVKKIYLTGLAAIPKEIAHKVELINLKELWNKKTIEEQDEILDIFSFDLDIKDKIKNKKIILFTQPLSEDKVILEEEKIDIYKNILNQYPKDKVVIKTHPREKTNYRDIFKDYTILDNSFPFEILSLLDVKFEKAVTLFSTAAMGLGKETEVDFYGTEIHPKIFERFGSCDNIMKRNKFL